MNNFVFKIYGERCSGTNYLTKLLQQNFGTENVFSDELKNNVMYFWKHDIPDMAVCDYIKNKKIIYIFIIREIQSWLMSLYITPYHLYKYNDFESFLMGKQGCSENVVINNRTKKMLNHDDTGKSVFEIRYYKIKKILKFINKNDNCILLSLKYLQNNYLNVLKKINNIFKLNKNSADFKNYNTHYATKKKNVKNRKYNIEITDKIKTIINNNTNFELENNIHHFMIKTDESNIIIEYDHEDKVSVIIPSFNRFNHLLKAIESVKNQTYKNIEIIVVNDCSTDKKYYEHDYTNFGPDFYMIHLPKNSQSIHGDKMVAGGGDARNIGMMMATGKYVAFLDDDDYFLPTKIEKQMREMKKNGCEISCTEALRGVDVYDPRKKYQTWHYNGHYWAELKQLFKKLNKLSVLEKMYDNNVNIWKDNEMNIHNCTCGGSSMVISKRVIKLAGYFEIKSYGEDYDYWKKIIKYSECVYLREPLTYINTGNSQSCSKRNTRQINSYSIF